MWILLTVLRRVLIYLFLGIAVLACGNWLSTAPTRDVSIGFVGVGNGPPSSSSDFECWKLTDGRLVARRPGTYSGSIVVIDIQAAVEQHFFTTPNDLTASQVVPPLVARALSADPATDLTGCVALDVDHIGWPWRFATSYGVWHPTAPPPASPNAINLFFDIHWILIFSALVVFSTAAWLAHLSLIAVRSAYRRFRGHGLAYPRPSRHRRPLPGV